MRLVLVLLVLVSIGCAMKMTGTREISIGQHEGPMTELLALVDKLRATIAELEGTTEPTKRRELALRARELLTVLDGRLQEQHMPKPDSPPGQQKVHDVIYPDGSKGQMTQEEWQNRDKSLGIKRVGPDGKPIEEPPEV